MGVSRSGATRCDALLALNQPPLANADRLADFGEPLPHNSLLALEVPPLLLDHPKFTDQLQ
jgi:hypothetical protein